MSNWSRTMSQPARGHGLHLRRLRRLLCPRTTRPAWICPTSGSSNLGYAAASATPKRPSRVKRKSERMLLRNVLEGHGPASTGGDDVIRILVVDDHPIVRDGLVTVLQDQADLHVAGSVGTAEEAVALAALLQPDVVLLDLELPGMDGVAAIPRLLEAAPAVRILVFTAYDTDEQVFGVIQAGPTGYPRKGANVPQILRGIRTVHHR